MKVAVVGAGISGLAAAYELSKSGADVVVYEKEAYLGGHARTVNVDGVDLDVGFMVFNQVSSFSLNFTFIYFIINQCSSMDLVL